MVKMKHVQMKLNRALSLPAAPANNKIPLLLATVRGGIGNWTRGQQKLSLTFKEWFKSAPILCNEENYYLPWIGC